MNSGEVPKRNCKLVAVCFSQISDEELLFALFDFKTQKEVLESALNMLKRLTRTKPW